MEPQSTTFVMEVKVDVVRLWLSTGLERLFHGVFDGKFVTLVVDEVDKVGIPVQSDLLVDVEFQGFDL